MFVTRPDGGGSFNFWDVEQNLLECITLQDLRASLCKQVSSHKHMEYLGGQCLDPQTLRSALAAQQLEDRSILAAILAGTYWWQARGAMGRSAVHAGCVRHLTWAQNIVGGLVLLRPTSGCCTRRWAWPRTT